MNDLKVLKQFLGEMSERVEDLEEGLRELEIAYSLDVINKLFRAIHTIKGGCGFFGLTKITQLSHVLEDLMMKIRDGEITFQSKMIENLYDACDALKDMLDAPDHGDSFDIAFICSDLSKLIKDSINLQSVGEVKIASPNEKTIQDIEEIKINKIIHGGHKPSPEVNQEEKNSYKNADLTVGEMQIEDKFKEGKPRFPVEPEEIGQTLGGETIKVKVELLDRLMELTGEIVISRNQLLRQFSESGSKPTLSTMAQMISDLQQLVLETRMQPIGGTLTKFNRVVRDLSKQVNKPIRLLIKGEETELDRGIIEALSDPLTHMIRNCASHGIEDAKSRMTKGKDPTGSIWLSAKNEGGQVAITVEDDGAGIDASKVKNKALNLGLISSKEFEEISEVDAINLIFSPGLSTAEVVSDLSGRGVGMDVVRSTIEKLGGVISVESNKEIGSKFVIYLPTTLTIMSSLIVRIDGDRFAIPHSELKEVILVRLDDEIQIEKIMDREVYRLRGSLIPILEMKEITGVRNLETQKIINKDGAGQERMFLVLNSGATQFGVVIDSIDHTEEIVIKPLPILLNHHSYYAGSSILGDSDVAMVLSANGICQSQKLNTQDLNSHHTIRKSMMEHQIIDMQEKQDLLVFRFGDEYQFAVPLSLINKIERIESNQIENIAYKKSVNLDGRNILLVFLDEFLELPPLLDQQNSYFVITTKIERFEVGIIASSIEASINTKLNLDAPPIYNNIVLGITRLHEKITMVLDLFSLAEKVSPERFKAKDYNVVPLEKDQLLVIDDTPFFRDLEKKYFESVGFHVTVASNGKEALEILMQKPSKFNLVISDIVMPVMDGYELVNIMKNTPELLSIPIIALTSFAEEGHHKKALAAGFDGYAVKTNKETILQAVNSFLVAE